MSLKKAPNNCEQRAHFIAAAGVGPHTHSYSKSILIEDYMILTVFRSRLNEQAQEEYKALVPKIVAVAETMPGFRSRKSYIAEDGERLSLVEFEDEQSQRNWALNAEHIAAQERGREHLYTEYTVQICTVVRESRFPAP